MAVVYKRIIGVLVLLCALSLLGLIDFFHEDRRLLNAVGGFDSRRLRFFDPDHQKCGKSKEAHDFAILCQFGAREREHYTRLTISTKEKIDPEAVDGKTIDKIFHTMAFLAGRTSRAIRVNMEVKRGYNHEHLQPYSTVSAEVMKSLNASLVEPGYWNRAKIAQKKAQVAEQPVRLGDDPMATLQHAAIVESTSDELLFSIHEIKGIDISELQNLTGWFNDTFVCTKKHPNAKRVSKTTDALSQTW